MNAIATIEIENIGSIKVELFPDTVNSTNNFISLANDKYYDGLSMHRIIPGFVAQGGCPLGTGTGGPGYNIDGEFKSNGFDNPHSHIKGAVAWARSMARNSAGSQFYITLDEVPHLDADYAVFGQVVDGMDVLDKLNALGTNRGTPKEAVKIKTITIELNDHNFLPVVKV